MVAADLETIRARAVDQHRRGDTDAAAALYGELLAVAPDDLTALHMLGVIALAQGRPADAQTWLARALAHHPSIAAVHADLGAALAALGRGPQAQSCLDRALALEPGHLLARVRRGALALELGAAAAALADAQAALALASDCVPAQRVHAAALAALGRGNEALASYRRVLALRPGDVPAALACMTLLLALARPQEALAAADEALATDPTLTLAHSDRGVALLRLGRPQEALLNFTRAIELAPDRAEGHVNLASALAALGQSGAALAACERALELDPGCAPALRNRALALFELGRPHAAVQAYEQALAVEPGSVAAHLGHATALRSVGSLEQACAALEAALALDPGHALARFHLADCSLHLGRYAMGWECYEARRLLPGAVRHDHLAGPEWTGASDIGGRTVYVCFEQAIGDTFQFVRYVRLLEERGARVVLSAPRALHALLASVSPTLTLVGEDEAVPRYDCHIPLMSLPRAFATTAATIPARVPYLAADPVRIGAWRTRLGTHGIRIGVAWTGAARRSGGGRAYPLAELAPLAAIPGVRLISLQRNAGADELASLPAGLAVEVPPGEVDAGADRFVDTAAIMACVDLVISCDTSIAHLAGALARPVWTALKFMPDWRWGPAGERSPWYPTMRLFRQQRRWDWAAVFASMARELEQARARGPALVPPAP